MIKHAAHHVNGWLPFTHYSSHFPLVIIFLLLFPIGEYLVIGVSMDDFKTDKWNPDRYFKGILSEENEKEAPYAFRSYLGIVASAPKNFTEFSRRVNHFMEMEPFTYPNPISGLGYKNIRIEAAYLYDAVMLYANVIRDMLQEYFWSVFSASKSVASPISSPFLRDIETAHNKLYSRQQQQQQRLIPQGTNPKLAIRHRRDHVSVLTAASQVEFGNTVSGATSSSTSFGGSGASVSENRVVLDGTKILEKIRDGREVSRRLRNIRYQSATGHETKMDENGDAEGNFTLVALKNRSNEFGLYPVGFFMRSTAQLPVRLDFKCWRK
ncbi:Guanylate cyclase 32E [Orchesella cincta]|uniref:Guanylate cyclase 32E n=1 Tax=Orchesella cincta TaxID=48709 RepID=A0A1D2N5M9_ORCCI|nr:Guanylate cyclase 32E [Orchesella cincta]